MICKKKHFSKNSAIYDNYLIHNYHSGTGKTDTQILNIYAHNVYTDTQNQIKLLIVETGDGTTKELITHTPYLAFNCVHIFHTFAICF